MTHIARLSTLAILTAGSLPLAAAESWPDFRGPSGDGIAPGSAEPPLEWSGPEGDKIAWSTPLAGRAWSSPVVWGDQVWLTNATEDGTAMSAVCLDFDSGALVREIPPFRNEAVEPLGNPVNGYGSPSPVIEAGRVYVHFGSYGTAAIDTATGEVLWKRTDLPCRHFRGPGSSPLLHGNLLILTMDGVDFQYLAALDKATGETAWKTDRSTQWDDVEPGGKIRGEGDFRKAYTTPSLARVGGQEILISPGAKACFAYRPDTGEELWHVTYQGYSNASRTVVHDGHAYINTGYGKPHLLKVKLDPGARGDITATHVEWDIFKRVPKRSSPIIAGGRLYMTTDEGILGCLDLETGDELWSDRLAGHFSASPVLAADRIYFFSEMGDAFVVKPGAGFELLAKNPTDEAGFMASPAFVGGSIIARSKTHVHRIAAD